MLIFILPPDLPSLKERGTRGEASKLVILPFVMATTWKDITKRKLTQGDWSLVAANLLPVIGVWFLNWSAQEVFLVYCLETIIIGGFTLIKMLITGLIVKKDEWQTTGGASTKQPLS